MSTVCVPSSAEEFEGHVYSRHARAFIETQVERNIFAILFYKPTKMLELTFNNISSHTAICNPFFYSHSKVKKKVRKKCKSMFFNCVYCIHL